MAIYRKIQTTFWTDTKVVDDFTPEDRYFYIYLLTNPHTNLCGCYEISIKQMADETGYSIETINKLIGRMETVHKTAFYNESTREILVANWHKYNWTRSGDFRKALKREIDNIKTAEYKAFIKGLYDGVDTVPTPSKDGGGTTVSVSASVTDTVSNTVSDKEEKIDKTPYQEVLDMYHGICVSLPTVRTYTDKRKKGVKARLETYSLNDIKEAFTKAEASSFMRGENDRKWKPDFEWFFIHGDNNIAKVLEGKYDDAPKSSSTGYDPEIFERLANERRQDID